MASKGRFGKYGGQYVPEIVMPVLNQLEEAYNKYKDDPGGFEKILCGICRQADAFVLCR